MGLVCYVWKQRLLCDWSSKADENGGLHRMEHKSRRLKRARRDANGRKAMREADKRFAGESLDRMRQEIVQRSIFEAALAKWMAGQKTG